MQPYHIPDSTSIRMSCPSFSTDSTRAISCGSRLLLTMNDLISYLNKKTQVDIAILDFNKAFDVVHV